MFEGSVLADPRLTLLGDHTQTKDGLGYSPYVEAMVEVLAQEQLQTPFIVGVFGHWGTGKSTFMTMLEEELSIEHRRKNDKPGGFHSVWFQPWQFEEKEEIWQALLLSVINYLELVARKASLAGKVADDISKTIVELSLGIARLALNQIISKATHEVLDFDQIAGTYSQFSQDNTEFVNRFRKRFEELKDKVFDISGVPHKRLFIFVDDLDRCTPENCIMALEAIKLFFDFEECVFVLGIDREIVQQGVRYKYKDSLNISGQDYIEKIIQLPFSLPPVKEEAFEQFVQDLTQPFGFKPTVVKLIVEASEQNPRRAKRLSNCLQLVRTVSERLRERGGTSPESISEEKLALLLTLQVRFPVAFVWLSRNPMTLSALQSGWGQLGKGGTEAFGNTLVTFLKQSYGEELAPFVADGFYGLWSKAHGEDIGVPPFTDEEDFRQHLRVTGVVEEGKARDALASRVTMGQRYDPNFASPSRGPVPEPPKLPPEPGTELESPMISEAQESVIAEKVTELAADYDRFDRTGFLAFVLKLPIMDWTSRRLVHRIDDMAANIESLDGWKMSQSLVQTRQSLKLLAPERPRRNVLSVARAVALGAFPAIFVLSWIFEFFLGLFGSLIFLEQGYLADILTYNLLDGDPDGAGALWEVYPQLDANLLAYFPGGAPFFTLAALATLYAVTVGFAARKDVMRLRDAPPGSDAA